MIRTIKHFLRTIGIYRYITNLYDYAIETYKFIHIIRLLNNKKGKTELFFFFSNYATGGAEKVHLQITEALKSQKPIVFFTDRSFNSHYKAAFEKNATVIEIHLLIRKHKHFLFRSFLKSLLGLIHASKKSKLFGCNSPFYYQLIPLLNEKVACFDLFHSLVHEHEFGPEKWSLPIVNKIHKRVAITHKVKNDLIRFYEKHNVDAKLSERITVINNTVAIPNSFPAKDFEDTLNVLFVGRPDPVKRIYLVGRIAKELKDHSNIKVSLIGPDLLDCIEEENRSYCTFLGAVTDQKELSLLYSQSHILLITSEREGMPLVVMEAVAHAVVPVTTNVGAIAEYIEDGTTGQLIQHTTADEIVAEAVRIILALNNNRNALRALSENAYLYAKTHFSKEEFTYLYQNLLS